jgi:pimeloyl-ACP methyl ester carboxylesterase
MKLVLLPGLDGTGDLFAPFVAAMRQSEPAVECQVVAYPPDREMNYAEHEAFARERLPNDDYVLLAESFSGPVGVSIAASEPPNLRGLIFCCSFASNPLSWFGPLSRLIKLFPATKMPPELFAPFLYAGHATPELRREHSGAMAKVSARTLRGRVASILSVDYSQQLRRIRVPMLYLLARRDRLIRRSAFNKIDRLRPDIQLQQIDAPHFLLQTQPAQAADAVRNFTRLLKTGIQA